MYSIPGMTVQALMDFWTQTQGLKITAQFGDASAGGMLLAAFWPQPLYGLFGLGGAAAFTQARFRRSRQINRWLLRVAIGLLGVAFLAHALAPRWFPQWSLWLQVGPICGSWLLWIAMLGVIVWFSRRPSGGDDGAT
ncbi:MAG TPA: hypothetical protein G4O04_09185 [Anaerolineae bacterium]|nr:hypothetical protein [Anaerolineae bacterium]HIQ08985.1 hypothetical protein [Anaerolineaceae bacterium]